MRAIPSFSFSQSFLGPDSGTAEDRTSRKTAHVEFPLRLKAIFQFTGKADGENRPDRAVKLSPQRGWANHLDAVQKLVLLGSPSCVLHCTRSPQNPPPADHFPSR
jgi:hypothetical protein